MTSALRSAPCALLLACVAPDAGKDDDTTPPGDLVDSGDTAEPLVLPSWVPGFTFTADAPEAGEGGVLVVPLIMALGGGIVVFDEAANVIWAYPQDDVGLGVDALRAHFSLDGAAVLFNSNAVSVDSLSHVLRVPLDGSPPTDVGITGGHTDFVEYTPGGYAALAGDIRLYGERKIMGDTIVERAPDGTERVVWSVFDDFEPNLDRTYSSYYVPDPAVEDWSHVNGISYSEADDAYYVSMTFNNGIAKIDRVSGTMDWYVGDPMGGDFENPDGDVLLGLPHSAERVDGGLLAFSRGDPFDPHRCSEAVELALDEGTHEVRRVWSYRSPDCLLVTFLGGAERLPGGNTVITWSSSGQIDEVTPDGRVTRRINTAVGTAFGASSWAPELGAR